MAKEKETIIEMQGVVTQCLSKCDSFLSEKLRHWLFFRKGLGELYF